MGGPNIVWAIIAHSTQGKLGVQMPLSFVSLMTWYKSTHYIVSTSLIVLSPRLLVETYMHNWDECDFLLVIS